jgi:hypothetical protein
MFGIETIAQAERGAEPVAPECADQAGERQIVLGYQKQKAWPQSAPAIR